MSNPVDNISDYLGRYAVKMSVKIVSPIAQETNFLFHYKHRDTLRAEQLMFELKTDLRTSLDWVLDTLADSLFFTPYFTKR
jgi:hypothetical protein